MTHDPLTEALKSIFKYIISADALGVHNERILKLILENLMLSAQIELLREINEGK